MDVELLTPLLAIEQRLNALVTSINSSPAAVGAPAAVHAVLAADDSLSSALQTLRTHQANYARIFHLREEANTLERRVREIVQEIGKMGDDISAIAGDDDESEDESDEEGQDMSPTDVAGQDTAMGETLAPGDNRSQERRKKEVDYQLLLDFARRISKYNSQAASTAASGGIPTRRSLQEIQDQRQNEAQERESSDIASITKQSTSDLDALAAAIRQAWLLPYPNDDKIRMGVMGKLQAAVAATGSRDDQDIEKEVQKIILAAEQGTVNADQAASSQENPEGSSDQTASVARHSLSGIPSSLSGSGSAKAPVPKAKLNLDLYDPDEDEG